MDAPSTPAPPVTIVIDPAPAGPGTRARASTVPSRPAPMLRRGGSTTIAAPSLAPDANTPAVPLKPMARPRSWLSVCDVPERMRLREPAPRLEP